jgi:hypothetical protein
VTKVEDLADGFIADGREQQRPYNVADVEAITELGSIAIDLNRLAKEPAANEHWEKPEIILEEALARSVDVGQAHRTSSKSVHPGVKEMELLGGKFVDPVHVDRRGRMFFVDRQVERPSVYLPSTRVHNDCVRRMPSDQLQEREMAAGVQVQVAHRIRHRFQMTHLPRDVEDHVHSLKNRRDDSCVIDVSDDDLADRADVVQVARVAAMSRDQGVENRDLGARCSERVDHVGSDKAEATGDHAAQAAKS